MGSDSVWVVEQRRLRDVGWEARSWSKTRDAARESLAAWRYCYPANSFRLTRYVSTRKGERRGKR